MQFVAGEAPGPNLSTGNPWEVDHGDQTKHVKMRRASFITPSFQIDHLGLEIVLGYN